MLTAADIFAMFALAAWSVVAYFVMMAVADKWYELEEIEFWEKFDKWEAMGVWDGLTEKEFWEKINELEKG